MSNAVSDFVGRRQRLQPSQRPAALTETQDAPEQDRRIGDAVAEAMNDTTQQPAVYQPIKPLTEDIAKDALRTATLYGNTVKERNDYARQLNEAMARIEQYEIKVSEQRSTIESLSAELAIEKEERIRLASGVEQLAHVIHQLGAQPH